MPAPVGTTTVATMAQGKAIARIQAIFGLFGVVALVIMYGLITGWNPLPRWGDWLRNATVRTLSTPHTSWTVRAGDQPSAATVLSQTIIVMAEGSVEAREPLTGARLWTRNDSWAVVAGDTQPVVLVGRSIGTGFDVYDANSGVRLWQSDEKAGIWAYSNMILVLNCAKSYSCTLRALEPVDGKVIWSLPITGGGGSQIGLGHPFAAIGPISPAYADSFAAIPSPAPPIIGLPAGDQIHVVSTANGKALHIYQSNASTRVALAAGTVLVATATLHGNNCYYTVQGRDPVTDRVLWSRNGYNLKTSEELGCDQRYDPVGGGDAVLAVDISGRDVLLDAHSGQILFRAPAGQHVVATDGKIAMVRTADAHSLRAIKLSDGRQIWTHPAGRSALVGVAPNAVLITDPAAEHLTVLDPTSGLPMLDAASGATILGIGTNVIIINIGRSFGPLPITPAP